MRLSRGLIFQTISTKTEKRLLMCNKNGLTNLISDKKSHKRVFFIVIATVSESHFTEKTADAIF